MLYGLFRFFGIHLFLFSVIIGINLSAMEYSKFNFWQSSVEPKTQTSTVSGATIYHIKFNERTKNSYIYFTGMPERDVILHNHDSGKQAFFAET